MRLVKIVNSPYAPLMTLTRPRDAAALSAVRLPPTRFHVNNFTHCNRGMASVADRIRKRKDWDNKVNAKFYQFPKPFDEKRFRQGKTLWDLLGFLDNYGVGWR